MQIEVIKVGGLLLKEEEKFNKIIEYLIARSKKRNIVLVCSAIGRGKDPYSTDGLNSSVGGYLTLKERNRLKAIGETYSVLKVAGDLRKKGILVSTLNWNRIGLTILGDKYHFDAKNIKKNIKDNHVLIVPGYIGKDTDGDVTTFPREGSDYSAVIFAYNLGLKECTLIKDIDGIYDKYGKIYHELTYDSLDKILKENTSPISLQAIAECKKHNITLIINNSSGCMVCKIK